MLKIDIVTAEPKQYLGLPRHICWLYTAPGGGLLPPSTLQLPRILSEAQDCGR